MSLFSYENKVALEAIDQQRNNKVFKDALMEQISIIRSKLNEKVYTSNRDIIASGIEVNKITDLILERTGVRLKFIAQKGFMGVNTYNAAISPYIDNVLNPLTATVDKKAAIEIFNSLNKNEQVYIEGYSNATYKKVRSNTNTIDTKNGRISGSYNNHNTLIEVDFKGFITSLKLTDGELAATIMHEVGHAFTFILFSDKLATMNESLQAVGAIRNKYAYDAKVNEMIKAELQTIDSSITNEDVENMVSDNFVTQSSALFSFMSKNLDMKDLSLYLVPTAANYNAETIADSYAARMGFGVELMQSLDKIGKGLEEFNKGSELFYNVQTNIILVSGILINAAAFGLPMATLWLLKYFFFYMLGSLISEVIGGVVTDIIPFTYKDDSERYRKIYNNEIDRIKTLDLTTQEKEEIISNLAVMKAVMGNRKTGDISLTHKIYTTLFRSRGNKASYDVQQDVLEKLANNELFVKALSLQLLGSK